MSGPSGQQIFTWPDVIGFFGVHITVSLLWFLISLFFFPPLISNHPLLSSSEQQNYLPQTVTTLSTRENFNSTFFPSIHHQLSAHHCNFNLWASSCLLVFAAELAENLNIDTAPSIARRGKSNFCINYFAQSSQKACKYLNQSIPKRTTMKKSICIN